MTRKTTVQRWAIGGGLAALIALHWTAPTAAPLALLQHPACLLRNAVHTNRSQMRLDTARDHILANLPVHRQLSEIEMRIHVLQRNIRTRTEERDSFDALSENERLVCARNPGCDPEAVGPETVFNSPALRIPINLVTTEKLLTLEREILDTYRETRKQLSAELTNTTAAKQRLAAFSALPEVCRVHLSSPGLEIAVQTAR